MKADRRTSAQTTCGMHSEYSSELARIGCFKGTFSLQIKDDMKPYQALPRCIGCAVHEPLIKKELERLQEHQILVLLGVDKTAKWCNSFVIVPKPNGTVCLCLGLKGLRRGLRPVHIGRTINVILPKLINTCYMTVIDASLGYHNQKLDKKHHTLPYLHVNLAGTDSSYYHLEWHQQMICSSKRLIKSSKTYQMYLVLHMTFQL